MGQALVRVVFVAAVVAWSYFAARKANESAWNQGFFWLSLGYWIFSVLYAGWSHLLVSRSNVSDAHFRLKRIVGLLADISALSAYTAITSNNGIVLFPIYLTTIIGYGYRFGLSYLYLAIAVGIAAFSVAFAMNPYLRSNFTLAGTYYLGLILVPLYASSLLKKHQLVLQSLRQVNEARSRFIANMSHELRTPLHAIISVSDVLREETETRAPAVNGASSKIGIITDSAQHLLALVNRILDIASADAMSFKVALHEPFDLYNVIRRVVNICKPGAQEKGLQFFLYVDPEVPPICRGSEQHVQEVLINTLGNAVKYTEKGSVQLRVSVESRASEKSRCWIIFQIIDTGIGISAQLMPRIFEPFTLGDDSASRKHSGTGLGLTITKQYIEQMGGSVKLTSREGQGTQCTLKLPFDELQDIEHSFLEGEASCLLVSESYLLDRDISFFESAHCSVHQTNPQKLSTVSTLGKYDIYLIDCNATWACPQDALSHLVESSGSCLVVEYGSDTPAGSIPANPYYTSRVRAGAIGDLISVRRLHHALFNRDEETPAPASASLRLLIADDNPVNLKTAELSLASAGHSIDLARDGDEALELLEQGDYDLAILDMHMPGMSGLDVARFYNFMNGEDPTPIILLTADATADSRSDSVGAGIRDVLTKPMRARDLRAAVAKYARKALPVEEPVPRDVSETVIRIDEALVRSTELEELIDLGTPLSDVAGIVEDFYTDTIGIFERALDAARQKRGATVKELMHSLKGSAATLGAAVLQKRAKRIEQGTAVDACRSMIEEEEELRSLLERTVHGMRRIVSEAQVRIRKGA